LQHELRDARDDIKKARTDFGGMKKRALEDIDRAIDQIELALRKMRPRR
jgi:hypothetical protein